MLQWRAERRILTLRTTCSNQRGETVLDGEASLLVEQGQGDQRE